MVFTIFYVSESLLHGPDAVAQVQDIIDRSTLWNASMGVTGALAFTERHFAQCIEGDEDTIRALMVRIENDPRHANVTIRRARPERVRRFTQTSRSDVLAQNGFDGSSDGAWPIGGRRFSWNRIFCRSSNPCRRMR
ncbi:BLUF domain-containing protein [Sphingomonas parapaucimobilis]|uniref:BLUF domain-containing protein n=1 Tax=Sphingomonas parapaucimobilis TaxID=28213 RepID=UPI003D271292